MAAATMSATTGMSLYVDGKLVGTNANTISETETKASFWRVGCGNLAGWGADWTGAGAPGNAEANNPQLPVQRVARRGDRLVQHAHRGADRLPVLDPLSPQQYSFRALGGR